MKLFIFSLFILLGTLNVLSQESNPVLIINPNGHKGQVRSLLVTSDKKYIVTGGFDKTIKVWDIESGELIREILGEIGTGSNGMVYSMALSPGDKYLATGGWYGKDDESEPVGDIRIFEFSTGKLLYLLKAHRNAVHALSFTPDGKNLISSDANGDLVLWDLAEKKIIRRYNHSDPDLKMGFDDEIKSIAVFGNSFVTADQYGRIKFWEINKSDTIKCDRYYEQIPADGVACSPDGNYISAVADTFLTVYDANYKPIAEATSSMALVFTAFSPDGKKILYGCSGRGDSHPLPVLSLEKEGWQPYAEFSEVDNSVIAGAFIDNETFAVAGGNRDEVIVVRLKGKDEKPEVLKRMSGHGDIIYAASLCGTKIAYADKWTSNFGSSKYNRQFDLVTKTFDKPDKTLKWTRPVTKQGNFTIDRYRRGDALNGGLMIYENKQPYDSIPLEYWNGDQHRCFTFVNNYIISGASYGMMRAYNFKGVELSRFVGHVGGIESVTLSSEGNRLISASDDRTMKIWELSDVGKMRNNDTAVSAAEYSKRMNIYSTFKKVFNLIKVTPESQLATKEAWLKVIDELGNNDYLCNTYKNQFAEYFCNEVYPLVSVFVDENGEWIIWNEEGYFTSSKKGSRFVGYHINQGKEKESKYFPFEQFDLKYNRPDIIMKDLSMVSEDVVNAYYLAYQKRLKRMGITESQLSGEIHLPGLIVENYSFDQAKQTVNVKIKASDAKYELDRLNIYVNDVPVYGTKGIDLKGKNSKEYSSDLDVQLCPGKNKIQVSVLNSKGAESLRETFSVVNNVNEKPDLYLITIGVSKYKDPKFNLNYAAKDADDFAKFFSESKLYGKVYIKQIINEQATRSAISELKTTFLSQAKTKDVVMIFAAGHGVLDNEMNYYFGTYDMDFMKPSNGGIAYEELEQLLDGIKPVKKLFFMDSCHSGELDKDEYSIADNTKTQTGEVSFRDGGSVNAVARSGFGLSQSAQLASDMFADLRRGTGATIISSAGGAEFAMEGEAWKNGLFTYCFLSGLKEGTADKNKDGEILISEIQDYVYKKVKELSDGKQRPTTRRENLEFDFRVW